MSERLKHLYFRMKYLSRFLSRADLDMYGKASCATRAACVDRSAPYQRAPAGDESAASRSIEEFGRRSALVPSYLLCTIAAGHRIRPAGRTPPCTGFTGSKTVPSSDHGPSADRAFISITL
jgi:hypothetical protein